jgi:hypothetical protein
MSAITAAAVALIFFVITQGILKLIIEPIQELRRLVGEVAHALEYYDDAHPDDAVLQRAEEEWLKRHREYLREARKAIHDLGGRLQASLWTIPVYDIFGFCAVIPKRQNVLDASRELRGWSKGLEGGDASSRADSHRKIVAQKLDIEQET